MRGASKSSSFSILPSYPLFFWSVFFKGRVRYSRAKAAQGEDDWLRLFHRNAAGDIGEAVAVAVRFWVEERPLQLHVNAIVRGVHLLTDNRVNVLADLLLQVAALEHEAGLFVEDDVLLQQVGVEVVWL